LLTFFDVRRSLVCGMPSGQPLSCRANSVQGIDMQRKQVAGWRSVAYAGVCLLFAGIAAAQSAPQGDLYTISRSVIANGGGVGSADCYVLVATIGEPVAGVVANGEFVLATGFLGEVPVRGDRLFRSGFETKKGECKP
jgi:hypothetical protein